MFTKASNITHTSTYIKLDTDDTFFWIIPLASDRIHFVFSSSAERTNKKSDILIKQNNYTHWSVAEKSDEVQIETDMLTVIVNRYNFQVRIFDRQGNLIYREDQSKPKEIEPVEVKKTRETDVSQTDMEITADGLRMRARDTESYVDRMASQVRLHFDFQDDEALYGLGSHEEGVGNLRGTHQYIYQQNMKASVPVLVSTKGYGLLFDSACLMTFRDDMHGSYMWFETVDQLDYVFYYGQNLKSLNRAYYALTGQPPLLPRWSFGYIQSKERYIDAPELIDIVSEYRKRNIPLDCIVLDWRSWEGDLWGEKIFDPKRFPDPKGMVSQIHDMKTKFMISIWPNMAPGGTNFDAMLEKGLMLGNHSTYNAFNEEARKLYWQQASEGLFSSGLDAWWCDCTEPFEGDWYGAIKPEPEVRININCDEARRYLDPTELNAYSLHHSRGIYEGQRSETNGKRVVNLTRSSYAGQHRYATITWSGDTAATWDMFKKQIAAATNFCVTGEPYWTFDIGGFFVKDKEQWFWSGEYEQGCDDPAYRELYLRMFQCAAFLPMFRSHGTDTPREVWRFGQPGEVIYDTLLSFIHLRYRLLPYIYSLAGQVTHDSGFLIAPPGIIFPNDKEAHKMNEAFMLGDAILVHPVTTPMGREGVDEDFRKARLKVNEEASDKKQTIDVYLPADVDWYDFWTGQKYSGGQTISVDIFLEIMPVFVKAGSIIPLASEEQVVNAQCIEDITYDELDIHVYTGSDACFDLYEDAGDGYDYENGQFAFTKLQWIDAEQKFSSEVNGHYEGFNQYKKMHIITIKP